MRNLKKIISAVIVCAMLCAFPGFGSVCNLLAWAAEITTVENTVYDTVEGAVYDTVEDAVYDTVEDAVYDTVEDAVYDTVEDAVYDTVEDAVYDTVEDAVYDTVEDAVYDTVEGNVYYTGLSADIFALIIEEPTASVFGEILENDVAPILRNNRTMLPARFVAENLGAQVSWDGEARIVTVKSETVEIKITIGSDVATVNGVEEKLDSPAFIENNRTYTPVRFIAEKLGANVDWDGSIRMVLITK